MCIFNFPTCERKGNVGTPYVERVRPSWLFRDGSILIHEVSIGVVLDYIAGRIKPG